MNDMTFAKHSQATMSSREIAEVVESRHDSVKRTMNTLELKGHITVTQTVEPLPNGGKPVTVYRVNKRDSYVVVAQLSPEFTARLVDRWEALESGRVQPFVQQTGIPELVQAADLMASALRLEGTARLTAMRSFSAANCPELLPMIPDYAIDAPAVAGGAESSLTTKAATALLKEHQVSMSAAAFNKLCEKAGILKKEWRDKKGGGQKSFWSITEDGLQYGKNITSERSPRETQPHWYIERFNELMTLLQTSKAA